MSEIAERLLPEFWPIQVGCWLVFYLLCLGAAIPHLHESHVFAYNTWAMVLLLGMSTALRPSLRYLRGRMVLSWLQLQACAFTLCFIAGTLATYLTALLTFGLQGFRLSYWTLSGIQSAMVLFLWATLYLGSHQWRLSKEIGGQAAQTVQLEASGDQTPLAARFTIRLGARIQIVEVQEILWIAAARDYVELHTSGAVHLLREPLSSLEKKLDPKRFIRIHRSKIVRFDQILELLPHQNCEYRLRLRDGSEHRSSRTYAATLSKWIREGTS